MMMTERTSTTRFSSALLGYEARQYAVRQALQQTVEQLVISQQVVRNDKLVMDRIISTMNGFVSLFPDNTC
jgi:hypothetical protein